MDDSESDTANEISTKKRRNEKEWKRNKIKRLRAEGKEYVNWNGKVVQARQCGKKCHCQKKCCDKFSDTAKVTILGNFNDLGQNGNKIAQDTYLCGLVKAQKIQRRRPRKAKNDVVENKSTKRMSTFKYVIKIGNEELPVCRDAVCSLHGITKTRLLRLANIVAKGQSPNEQRGKHSNRPNAVTEDVLQLMNAHICKFPYNVSHYGNVTKKRRYLSSALTVRKMYELFLKEHSPEALKENKRQSADYVQGGIVSYRTYLKYFRDNFNYGFGKPATDKCRTCEELKVNIKNETDKTVLDKLQVELELHKQKAKKFYKTLESCTKLAKENDNIETITFNFQQNLPVPVTNVTEEFYSRQLWVFNFGIHRMSDDKAVMYMYSECDGKKGCCEVASFLKHFIDTIIPAKVKQLYVFSDGCVEQNQNNIVMQFLYTLMYTGRFEEIEQYFPVRGHSYLPNDRDFSIIERQKRKHEKVEVPQEWYDIVRNEAKFEVVEVNQEMMFDFKTHFSKIFKKNMNAQGKGKQKETKFLISKCKAICYSSSHRYEIKYSETIQPFHWQSCSIKKIKMEPTMPTQPLYQNQIPIKAAKMKDLKNIIHFISDESKRFYEDILFIENKSETDCGD